MRNCSGASNPQGGDSQSEEAAVSAPTRSASLTRAPASVARVNYSYRYQLTLVCKNSAAIRRLLSYVLAEFSRDRRNKGITALIDVNSYQ